MYFSPHTVETSWYQNHYTPRNHIWSCTNNKIQTRNNPSKVPNCSISKIATVGKLNFLLKENSCGHTSIDQVVQLYQVVVHVCRLSAWLYVLMSICQSCLSNVSAIQLQDLCLYMFMRWTIHSSNVDTGSTSLYLSSWHRDSLSSISRCNLTHYSFKICTETFVIHYRTSIQSV